MRMATWVVGVAVVVGCATGGQEKKSETLTAQDQALRLLQQAADAQKRAANEQAKAEQAERNLMQKQKELTDAQASVRSQRAKAEQAQRDAQVASENAQQQAQQLQQQAMQKQQMRSVTQSGTQEQNVTGKVVQAQGDQLQVRMQDQDLLQLQITESTTVKVNGQVASVSQIQPGSDVRASYQMVDGKAKALKIDSTSKASGQ